jgi:hypothetical protein
MHAPAAAARLLGGTLVRSRTLGRVTNGGERAGTEQNHHACGHRRRYAPQHAAALALIERAPDAQHALARLGQGLGAVEQRTGLAQERAAAVGFA